jgi:hypothetical protein
VGDLPVAAVRLAPYFGRKGGCMKHNKSSKQHPDRIKTTGENPKAADSPDRDENHDESRRNMYDPEVGKALEIREEKAKDKE